MRYPDASGFDSLIMWAANVNGPVAPPGRYTVRLTVGSDVQSQPLIIKADPRSTATPEAIAAQFALLMQIHDRLSAANDAVKTIRNVTYQIRPTVPPAPGRLHRRRRRSSAHMSAIEAADLSGSRTRAARPAQLPIRLNNKIASLAGTVASADGRPTGPSYAVFRVLSAQLDHPTRCAQDGPRHGDPETRSDAASRWPTGDRPAAVEPPAAKPAKTTAVTRDRTIDENNKGSGCEQQGVGSEVEGKGTATAMAITDAAVRMIGR